MVSMPKFHDFLPNFQKENTTKERILEFVERKSPMSSRRLTGSLIPAAISNELYE